MIANPSCYCDGNAGGVVDVFECVICDARWHQPAQRWDHHRPLSRVVCPECGVSQGFMQATHGKVTCFPYLSFHPLQAELEDFMEAVA